MNWLDFVVIILLVAFTFAGWSSGLIREVVTLLGVVFGIVIAGVLYERLAKDVLVFVDNPAAAEAVAYLMLFGAVYLLGQIGAYVFKTSAALVMLGPWDHLGGAVFGLLKGLIVVQVLLVVFAAYPSLGMHEPIENSEIAVRFVDDWSFLSPLLPDEIEQHLDAFLAPEESAPVEG